MTSKKLETVQGDITKQPDISAVVNAANEELAPGGGVAGAIHRAAGPELYKSARKLAPIKPGECVITGGYNLPNDYVIHCLGPRYGIDKPADKLLAACYTGALDLAEENGVKSIAFPAISTGAFGYPLEAGAKVALEAIKSKFDELEHIELIRFVLFTTSDLEAFRDQMQNIFD